MREVVARVMDGRLADLLARWGAARPPAQDAEPLRDFAPHEANLLVIEDCDGHSVYAHYGSAFARCFGQDLTGQVIDMLPTDILPADRRGMLAFEYTFARKLGRPLWRSYTACFAEGCQTWQRLVLPLPDGRLAVGAYPVPAHDLDTDTAEGLLRLMIERVPVVVSEDGQVEDLALSLQAFSDTQLQVAELEVLASRDPLTGVANLRHFHHLAGLELDHCRRMGRPFALLALDIDHFKRINDNHGHATGDRALQGFVAACHVALRKLDILGRCGGEEFAVALPNTGLDGAATIAERLRRQVEEFSLPLESGALSFTVSIGLAAAETVDSTTIAALMDRADKALYRSKREGRNRVSVG